MRPLSLIVAVVVVLATNAAVLFHVVRNRAGGPVATMELSERELTMESNLDQNAGVLLRLNWGNTARWSLDGPDADLWFNREKLGELGFDVHVSPGDAGAEAFYRSVPSKKAWVALEFQSARPAPGLMAVDVALDPEVLRRRRAGAEKLVIAGGIVRLSLDRPRDPRTHQPAGPTRLRGIIIQILNPEIWVPLPHSRILEALKAEPSERRPAGAAPRYAVTLAWGAQHEPWVVYCRLLNPGRE